MSNSDGLKLRNGWWHISKTLRVGHHKRIVREATGFSEEEKNQAIEYKERRFAEIRAELSDDGPSQPTEERTFNEAAVEYVLSLERRGKDPERSIYALKSVDPYIGNKPLSHVHQGALVKYEQAMRGKHSSGTVSRTYAVIVAVLNYAARVLRDGNVPWLAMAVPKISPPDWDDTCLPYKLTWEEQDALLKALAKPRRKHLINPVLFGLACGAREQEICGLSWSWEVHVDGMPQGSVWEVPASVRKGNSRKSRSQQKGRYLVCNTVARSVIDSQRGNGRETVFPLPNGGQIQRLNNHGWRSAWEDAGLPKDGYVTGVHNLRHTFGERMEAAGIPKEYRKALLGHESGDVTDLYSAPGLARMLEQAEKVKRGVTPQVRPVAQIIAQGLAGKASMSSKSLI